MTSIRILLSAVLASLCVTTLSAQQKKETPPPDAKGQATPQGFSVVLVLGDMQSASTSDNVPAAARKALADMKDFLPYRGYRLLDTQWILGSSRAVTRLRGVDEQDYQLTLRSLAAFGKLNVTFLLQEPGALESAVGEASELAARRAQVAELRVRLETLEREAAALRERFGEKHIAVQNSSAEIAATKQRIANAEGVPIGRGRSVIDTSFAMEIGETVVVGTSRMRGGDKALIALLTAVPKRGVPMQQEQ